MVGELIPGSPDGADSAVGGSGQSARYQDAGIWRIGHRNDGSHVE